MNFFSRVLLPLFLFIYIGVETYFKLNKSSLCEATGCKLAGELLRFNPLYLNYLGLASVFFLILLGYFSLKSKIIERLFFIVLYSAIAFETTIISYQFIANPEPCTFCLGIFSSLLLIALLSHSKRFAAVLAVVLSIFLALSTLAIGKNKAYTTADGLYLIQSDTCGHCKQVKKYFEEHNISYMPISVNEASARSFLKFVNISTIPVAVIKEPTGVTLINGDKAIIAHFEEQKKGIAVSEITEPSVPLAQSSALGVPSEIFSATSEPGCAITVTETPACADNNSTH